MSLFVYVTDACHEDAITHGLGAELDGLRRKVEAKQNTSQFDRFPKPYLVKKKLGGRQGRLIAEEREIGEHVVIVFLAIMIRGSREYESGFAVDPQGYGSVHLSGRVDDNALLAHLEERTRSDPVTPKPLPSEEEYALLYSAFADAGVSATGAMVFETREWVEAIAQDRISKQLAYLTSPVADALSGPDGVAFHAVAGKKDWGVWAYRRADKVVLLVPATETTAASSAEAARMLASRFDVGGMDAILQASRRAYPQLVLADDELWLDLEHEHEANLALSPEESQVLESTRSSAHPFPLFINGRAGSGKSTILQYLFASFLHGYRRSPAYGKVETPIYLTANAELLRVARGVVGRLLRKEFSLADGDESPSADELEALLSPAFKEFYAYVGSLVPGEMRKSRFANGKRLDYTGFRARWNERFGKDRAAIRDFGPDVSWHVIRTYIKGRASETLLEPEDYEQLPESERSVTLDSYRRVYERVWTGWYSQVCEAEGYWDDQDLVRYVLDNDLVRPVFPAVFCDEAQDFTRLELELLLRINAFSERTLPSTDLSRVCFVFAGDQFQTLNPTGFRWDAIKATFVEKFILELDPARRSGRMDLNYRELEYNYRSARRIVRFGNLVQAMRAALFSIPDLRPQTPWLTEPREFPVVAFRNRDAQFWNRFRENAGWIVIVPCADGEELRYVQDDPVLRERILVEDGVPQNVLSPSRAKGCEYADVVVYGFGGSMEKPVLDVLRDSDHEPDGEGRLPLEYFINRLYVAVSRAKRRLVIVDSDAGFENLWGVAQDEKAEAALLGAIKNGPAVWGGAIEGMTWGIAEELARDMASDPRENAAVFERDGLLRRDSFLMIQAGQSYRAAGDMPKARECRAKALEFGLQHLEAGAAYVEAGDASGAVRCYWAAGREGWAALATLQKTFADVGRELEYAFARAIATGAAAREASDLVEQLINRLGDPAFAEQHAGSLIWRDALSALLHSSFEPESRQLPAPDNVVASKTDAVRMAGLLARAKAAGASVLPADEAVVLFHAEKYSEAARAWESVGLTAGQWYSKAKAYSDPYPQRVVPLAKRKEWPVIVDAYRSQPDDALTVEQATAVVEALIECGHFNEALQLGWRAHSTAGLARLVAKAAESNEIDLASRARHAWIATAVRQSDWDIVERLVERRGLAQGAAAAANPIVSTIGEHRDELQLTFIRAFARTGAITSASEMISRKITEFLRDRLRVRTPDWQPFISVVEAGAAIERAGKFVDALSFYDAVRKQIGRDDEQEFAKRRRLVALERQLVFEKSKRESGQTRQLERELRQAMAVMRVASIEELGEFPNLSPLDLASLGRPLAEALDPKRAGDAASQGDGAPGGDALAGTRSDKVACEIGELKIDFSRSARRVNITHLKTMETAFVKLQSAQCGGEGGMVKTAGGEFTASEWGVSIRPGPSGEGMIEVVLDALGASIRLEA